MGKSSTSVLSVTELARNFSEYLNRVAFRGERFVLTRGKREIAELRPRHRRVLLRDLPELLSAAPRLTAREAAAYERDIEESRRAAAAFPVRDAWTE